MDEQIPKNKTPRALYVISIILIGCIFFQAYQLNSVNEKLNNLYEKQKKSDVILGQVVNFTNTQTVFDSNVQAWHDNVNNAIGILDNRTHSH